MVLEYFASVGSEAYALRLKVFVYNLLLPLLRLLQVPMWC
jgi:hypothetical protein